MILTKLFTGYILNYMVTYFESKSCANNCFLPNHTSFHVEPKSVTSIRLQYKQAVLSDCTVSANT